MKSILLLLKSLLCLYLAGRERGKGREEGEEGERTGKTEGGTQGANREKWGGETEGEPRKNGL